MCKRLAHTLVVYYSLITETKHTEAEKLETFIIALANMEKIKNALGYRPKFHHGNSCDVQVDLTDDEHDLVSVALSDDRYFVIRRYNINMFCG